MNNLHWLGHDAFRIDGSNTIYIDPWNIPVEQPVADLILITHDHFDHCSPEDVAQISVSDTLILTGEKAADLLKGKVTGRISMVTPGQTISHLSVEIETVAAYNINKFRSPGNLFHPRDANYVGFIITMDGRRIYHAGDTDNIAEMNGLKVDVALLPVSGTYVMTWQEAVAAAETIETDLVVPMHYGAIVGSEQDARRFAAGYSGRTEIVSKAS